MISGSEELFGRAENLLTKKFGPLDYQSPLIKFDFTTHYEPELGPNLWRKFISFKRLIRAQDLSHIKIYTNRLERKFSTSEKKDLKRKNNLDPGYVSDAKLVLATGKDYCHRIYLNQGIYAEVTLYFQEGTFRSWPWTYPDYKTKQYIDIFNELRRIYLTQVKF